jgi:hypothetical protein
VLVDVAAGELHFHHGEPVVQLERSLPGSRP